VDIIISGGAAHVLRQTIKGYFSELGVTAHFADEQQIRLTEMVSHLPEAHGDAAIALRMMDGYGLFQGLIGKLNSVAV
jgi:hypothetical protein